jgi:hypothetical protein
LGCIVRNNINASLQSSALFAVLALSDTFDLTSSPCIVSLEMAAGISEETTGISVPSTKLRTFGVSTGRGVFEELIAVTVVVTAVESVVFVSGFSK